MPQRPSRVGVLGLVLLGLLPIATEAFTPVVRSILPTTPLLTAPLRFQPPPSTPTVVYPQTVSGSARIRAAARTEVGQLGARRDRDGNTAERVLHPVRPDVEDGSVSKHFINWYPGHIAKAERELQDFLKLVDVVIEARDARIPTSTTHPLVRECKGLWPWVIWEGFGVGLSDGGVRDMNKVWTSKLFSYLRG